MWGLETSNGRARLGTGGLTGDLSSHKGTDEGEMLRQCLVTKAEEGRHLGGGAKYAKI